MTTCDAVRYDAASKRFDILDVFNTLACDQFPCDVRFVVATEWGGTTAEVDLAQLFRVEVRTQGGELVGTFDGRVTLRQEAGVIEPSALADVEGRFHIPEPGYFRVRVLDADDGLLGEKRVLIRSR